MSRLARKKGGGRRDQIWDLGRAPGFGSVWYDERNIQSTPRRALADVMATLRSIFDTKFCSPGALGGLSFGLQTAFCAELSCCGCLIGQTSIRMTYRAWCVIHVTPVFSSLAMPPSPFPGGKTKI